LGGEGGGVKYQKKFEQNFNQGKKYLAQETYREKIVQSQSAMVLELYEYTWYFILQEDCRILYQI
jgi:hypothetical protein